MHAWLSTLIPTPVLCPYCFMRFKMSAAPFRCANVSCANPRAADPILAKAWPSVAPLQRGLLIDPVPRKRRVSCPDCRLETSVRVCAQCHIRLPREFDRSSNAILAIVGAKEAGKSHFIASAIHELKNRVASEMHLSLEAMDDQTMDRYKRQYEEPLYGQRQQLTATSSGLINAADTRLPMLFSLKLRGKDLFGRTCIVRSITLAFFDTAGEDLNVRDTMGTVNRYIAEAAGIIMLLDPLQMNYVRALFTSAPPPAGAGQDQTDLLTRVSALIRDVKNLSEHKRINIPLAVTLSKFDQLEKIIPDGMIVKESAAHTPEYDDVSARTVIDEVESLLGQWKCDSFLEQVRTNYTRHGFFGVTSTGCNVDSKTGRFPAVKPNRVEDPFLWLLHQIGFLRAKARQKVV